MPEVTEDLTSRIRRALGEGLRFAQADGDSVEPEAMRAIMAVVQPLADQLAELNDAITWETACLNCASMLTRSYEDYCRAEQAEALLQTLGAEKCGTCGNWVEHLGMVLHFRAEHATAEDLAESTLLPTPATQAGAVAGPATRSEEERAATLARIRQAWVALDDAGDRLAAVGMDEDRWRQIVEGERRPTSLDFALIAEVFGTTVDWLLSGTEAEPFRAIACTVDETGGEETIADIPLTSGNTPDIERAGQ